MNVDMDIKRRVENELEWEPSIDAANIGVSVREAIVTLSGRVSSRTAETAVLRIYGIRGVASELRIQRAGDFLHADEDIVRAAAQALLWDPLVPEDSVDIVVTDGVISLQGTVEWAFQRDAAQRAVGSLMGVRWAHRITCRYDLCRCCLRD